MTIKKRYLIPVLALLTFSVGPRPHYPAIEGKISALDIPLADLDRHIAEKEALINDLKPDNQARVIWADSVRRTPYSIVYLHGFSASPMEADPIHLEFARRYGCNMYLARLAGHGTSDPEAFAELTPKQLVDSAKEAIAIGQLLGEKVILMSCSTGSTLSIYLTANNPELIHSQILYSPNIDLESTASEMLAWPWGLQIARTILGEYNKFTPPPGAEAYWTTSYRIEGLVALKYLLNETMTDKMFKAIHQPLFLGYYYKNEEERETLVSIDDMKHFYEMITTPEDKKELMAFPDVGAHVIANHFQSKDLESVREKTFVFAENILMLQPKE
ncbi:MAG: hypothetical protein DHS20C18_07940 [Saprospiraceae bacterium]|nr:MAG: hypothetical protein DHS20C18_07940 [Saprospiraceae bacterium]